MGYRRILYKKKGENYVSKRHFKRKKIYFVRHDHVLRDIKQEIERWFPIKDGIKEAFGETEYTTKANQLKPCYKLDLTGLEIMLYRYRDKTLLKSVSKKKVTKI